MNPKHSLVFFSAGVVLILALFLMGVPINIISESQQNQIESNLDVQQDDENFIQEDDDTIKPIQKKPIDQMDCTELNQFTLSFEKGWGTAIRLYNEKCS